MIDEEGTLRRLAIIQEAIQLRGKVGQIFYVDGIAGNDAWHGRRYYRPLLTYTEALARCRNDRNDYIIVLDYWSPGTETWPIVVDKSMVHIIGLQFESVNWSVVVPAGDTASFNVTAHYVEIAYLEIGAGATMGAIHVGSVAGVWGLNAHHCSFGWSHTTGQDGIRNLAGGDAPYLNAYACIFGQGLTRDGIRIEHNATRGRLGVPGKSPNIFNRVGGIGIDVIGPAVLEGIFDNRHILAADVAGGAISFINPGSSQAFIDGNRCGFGNQAADFLNNPYRDLGNNHWGVNWKQASAILPTVV